MYKKFSILCDSLNKKKLLEKGLEFEVSGIIAFSKEITKDEFEEYQTYTYEMIYGDLNPILIAKDAPAELKQLIIGAALSHSYMTPSVDNTIEKYTKIMYE